MQKTKLSAHTGTSSHPVSTISNTFRFQKLDNITQIVSQLQHTQLSSNAQNDVRPNILQGSAERAMSSNVLTVIKKRIQTNYDNLYSNYPQNKTKIYKQIQTVENNVTGENVMTEKHNEVIKEKNKYDKIKNSIDNKQKKLKKVTLLLKQLQQLKHQLERQDNQHTNNREINDKIDQLTQKKTDLEHQNISYQHILKERQAILHTLKKVYQEFNSSISTKQQKSKRTSQANIKKKALLLRLQQKLTQAQPLQLPGNLASQLQVKLQEYQNRQSYSNILHHEAVLEQRQFQQTKWEIELQKQEQKINRAKKDQQQRKQLQVLQNMTLLNEMQANKIKKLIGITSLQDLPQIDIEQAGKTLSSVNNQIQQEIKQLEKENQSIQKDIASMAQQQGIDYTRDTLETLTDQLHQQQTKANITKDQLSSQRQLYNHWQTIMQFINNNNLTEEGLRQWTTLAMNYKQKPVLSPSDPSKGNKMDHSKPQSECDSISFD